MTSWPLCHGIAAAGDLALLDRLREELLRS